MHNRFFPTLVEFFFSPLTKEEEEHFTTSSPQHFTNIFFFFHFTNKCKRQKQAKAPISSG